MDFLEVQDGCTHSQPRNHMKANQIRIPGSFNPRNQPKVLIGNGAGPAQMLCSVWKFCHLLWLTASIRPLLGKVIFPQLLNEFSVFCGARRLGTCWQGPAICPCTDPYPVNSLPFCSFKWWCSSSSTPRFPKELCFLEGSQASPICPPCKSNV
jgi:hypothetical protein